MISKYNASSVNCLSNKIQNELVGLLGNKSGAEVISEIKKAKYFFTVIRLYPWCCPPRTESTYINATDGKISIEERFIDFIHTHEKTGSGLSSQFLINYCWIGLI
jgi:hypothetical protein